MNDKKRSKFLSKTATFSGKSVVLWSLDGVTWSTRKDELQAIHDRHEAERLKSMQSIGEVLNDERTKAPLKDEAAADEEDPVEIKDADPLVDEIDEEDESDDDKPASKKLKPKKVAAAPKAKPAKGAKSKPKAAKKTGQRR